MKKTLAVLMAALLAVACFAMVGSAATTITLNNEDYPGVSILGGKDLALLVDGETLEGEAEAWGSSGIAAVVPFQNANCIQTGTTPPPTTTLALVLDLGEEKTISSIDVWFYKDYNVMIGLGQNNTLTVSSSEDGATFEKVTDYEFDSQPAMLEGENTVNKIIEVAKETIAFDAPVTTQYIELKMNFEESSEKFLVDNADPSKGTKPIWEFIAMTEIAVNEGSAGGDTSEPAGDTSSDADTSSEAPTTSSEAPTTSSEAPATSSAAESSTPSTGDAGMIAIVVLAAAAVIGAAVIVKKRA